MDTSVAKAFISDYKLIAGDAGGRAYFLSFEQAKRKSERSGNFAFVSRQKTETLSLPEGTRSRNGLLDS